jgi:trk system potassium uptake protein TrkA
LANAANSLDVKVIAGDISSINILEEAKLGTAKLFIAVTTNESTNLLSCILAKKMGVKQTVARVKNSEFLAPSQKEYFKSIGIDNLFSPRYLAAREVKRLISRVSATDVFEFEDGKISIIGFTADNSSPLINKSFRELYELASDQHFRVIVVLRNSKTFIPKSTDIILPEDHLYLSTDVSDFDQVNALVGKTLQKIKNIMIIGDTPIAKDTAELLENDFNVKVVLRSASKCRIFLKDLKHASIIKGDPSNTELLLDEGLDHMDAFIALTSNSETNILSSLMADNLGVYKTVALVDNPAYTHLSQKIGVDTIINKKLLAANNIFRYVRKGKIEAIASFHGVDAEIIEFTIHKENQLVKKTLKDLNFPEGMIVAGVIRNDIGIIPNALFKFILGDKVIVFALQEVMKRVESIFK